MREKIKPDSGALKRGAVGHCGRAGLAVLLALSLPSFNSCGGGGQPSVTPDPQGDFDEGLAGIENEVLRAQVGGFFNGVRLTHNALRGFIVNNQYQDLGQSSLEAVEGELAMGNTHLHYFRTLAAQTDLNAAAIPYLTEPGPLNPQFDTFVGYPSSIDLMPFYERTGVRVALVQGVDNITRDFERLCAELSAFANGGAVSDRELQYITYVVALGFAVEEFAWARVVNGLNQERDDLLRDSRR
ncbi:hypothetical protein MRY87_00005 [bacterium]|nr:hypothetical protein [bacterium]